MNSVLRSVVKAVDRASVGSTGGSAIALGWLVGGLLAAAPPSTGAATAAATAAARDGTDAAGAATLEEITVFARRRAEPAREVPFALTVLDAPTLAVERIDDTLTLFRRVPGLSLTSFDDGRFAYFQLRGIGPLSQAISPDDGSVVTYVDGVPQPVYASEAAYLDLDRIEVLRGPQGTLFGRNSQGGALSLATRLPGATPEGRLRVEAGEDRHGLVDFAASGPLGAERWAGGVAARLSTIDGFVPNVAPRGGELGDRDVGALRATLVREPVGDDGSRWVLSANVDRQDSRPFYYVRRGEDRDAVQLDPENRVRRTAWGASLRATVPLRLATLESITALNGFDNEQVTDDTDGLIYGPLFGVPPAAFLPPLDFSDWREAERRFYQELRLAGRTAGGADWTAGAAYFRSDFDVELDNRSTFSPFLNGDRDAEQIIDSYAAFGEVTAPLFGPRLRGTLGLRYTRDEKSLDATFTGVGFPGSVATFAERSRADFDLWTGRAALSYDAADAVTLYATAGRGAKSGGFPRFTLSAALELPSRAYAASTSWTYELGAKVRPPGGRARLDVAAFANDVRDEQLFVLDFVSFQFLPVNLDTRSRGLELEGDLLLGAGWTLSGGLAWTDAEIREADALSGARAGNGIPNVARFSSALALRYEGAPGARGAVPVLHVGHQYLGERAADVAGSFDLPAHHNVDVRAGARLGRYELFAFARNLLDERQEINGVLYGPGVEAAAIGRGRVVGVGATASFGP